MHCTGRDAGAVLAEGLAARSVPNIVMSRAGSRVSGKPAMKPQDRDGYKRDVRAVLDGCVCPTLRREWPNRQPYRWGASNALEFPRRPASPCRCVYPGANDVHDRPRPPIVS
jgi:hypothetical protein